jgi:hypothetical protein
MDSAARARPNGQPKTAMRRSCRSKDIRPKIERGGYHESVAFTIAMRRRNRDDYAKMERDMRY